MMNSTLDNNLDLLANLYEQYPDSFDGLRMQGEYLVYGEDACNISRFNLYDLVNNNRSFLANIDSLTAEDIFKIIRLHTLSLESKSLNNEDRLEVIKRENPLLKSVTIIPRNERTGQEEIINIVDSNGKDNMFVNTYRIDFFDLYEDVKAEVGADEVTPEDLIAEINRRVHRIELESARDFEEKSDLSEDFGNKITRVNDPYQGSNTTNVYGNEEMDIALVSNELDPDKHEVVTFSNNEFGDTVIENHQQNVTGEDTVVRNNTSTTTDTSVTQGDDVSEDVMVDDEPEEEIINLISSEEFYELVNSNQELSSKQKEDLRTYYAFLGDLMIYEEYLMPELMEVLNTFRAFILDLNVRLENAEEALTINQEDALKKSEELEARALEAQDKVVNNELDFDKTEEKNYERSLRLERKYKSSSEGFISTFAIISIIVIVVIIMTIITLALV